MKIVPYLNFNGNCREAFDYYHQVLGGETPEFYTNQDVPMDNLPAGMEDKVIHAQFTFEGQSLMGCDNPPDWYEPPRSVSISIQHTDGPESERLFNALADGGSITMPWGQQPWGALFGMCVDRFGIPWMINCEPSN
jgi:PhnB protein